LVGDQRKRGLSIEELGDALTDACRGALVHLGGCGVLRISDRRVKRFLETTGAVAVCGYERSADWLEAAGLELLLFSEVCSSFMTVKGIARAKERVMVKAPGLVGALGFRLVVNDAS
jgi:hypothetical protein